MEITLFMDTVDRDVFTEQRVRNAGWQAIYKDSYPAIIEGTEKILPSFHKGFTWQSKVFLRAEGFGGLLFDAATNRVFKIDQEAYSLLAQLWDDKKVTKADENYENLVSLLLKHNLIRLTF